MQRNIRPLEILLVEDNPGDVRLTREAMKGWQTPPRITVAGDGVEALDALETARQTPRTPDLILLDLNLPRLGGRELLEMIKSSEDLRQIPVIVLSTSDDDDDVNAAYSLHANCYLVKPVSLDHYMEMVSGIERFWLDRARLPTASREV